MKSFLELFSQYKPNEQEEALLRSGTLQKVRADRALRMAEAEMSFPKLVDYLLLEQIERAICKAYSLTRMRILPRYAAALLSSESIPQILHETERIGVVSKGFFDDYRATLEAGKLTVEIFFCDGGVQLLSDARTPEIISRIVREEFGVDLQTQILRSPAAPAPVSAGLTGRQREKLMDIVAEHEAFRAREAEARASAQAAQVLENASAAPRLNSCYALKGEDIAEPQSIGEGLWHVGNMTFDASEPDVIFGEGFEPIPQPISVMTGSRRGAIVFGEVLGLETKETRRGDKMNISFTVTDDYASVTVRMYVPMEQTGFLKELKAGSVLALRGSLKPDNFDGEPTFSPVSILRIKKVPRQDNAVEKRVELHLHTQLSAMDATIPPDAVIKMAKAWGHSAVAITDHGNVQAFPIAMNAAEKLGGIKVIYGMEAYFVDDTARAVYGSYEGRGDFDDTYVVFDIETTGLSAAVNHITEIGAVRVRAGETLEVFSTFVDPGEPIPENITALTGITDEMVKGAPSEEEAVRAFLAFAGNCLLIAHNAGFDTGFIRRVCTEHGIPFPNAYLDTVAMSRYVNPDLRKHKLDTLAEYFHLGGFNHHRACDDAEMLAAVFFRMTDKLSGEGIHCLSDMMRAMSDKVDPRKLRSYHMILLVKNQTGLKNLYKLISMSYLKYYYKHPRIPRTMLEEHREGLIVGSACSEGILFNALLEGKPDSELKSIAEFFDYLEIQPTGNDRYLIDSGRLPGPEAIENLNRKIIELGEQTGRPVVATCDAHFMERTDEIYRKILLAGMKFSDADRDVGLYYRTTEEMLKEFEYLGEAKAREVVITNTNAIAAQVEEIRPIPKGTYTPHMDGAEEDLQRICYERARELYGDPLPEIVEKRLDKELTSIISHGFAVLYMIAQKLVQFSESQGYLVGSRGSVGSSFVASMAGISEVNPLPPHRVCPKCKYSEFITDGSVGSGFDLEDRPCPHCGTTMRNDGHDIPFETFLGFYGDKSPDIDLNFSGDVQGRVHKFTEQLFGAENVFRAGTLGTLADKTAYGFVMKYAESKQMTLTRAETNRLVSRCVGVKRTTGQHPGGIIVVPREYEVYDFTPVQHPADAPDSDIVTTHFAFSYLHDTILKLDELGHDVPTKYKWIERFSDTSVMEVPMNDRDVYELFLSTKSLGVSPDEIGSSLGTYGLPEFGTNFAIRMLEEAKPHCFADLLQISGLSHGTDVWTGNAEELIKAGTCTISQVIGCRDNIMNDLIRFGVEKSHAFKIMESVRKGRGLTPEWEEEIRASSAPEWYIPSCKKIKYMFPKAHAAAYVMSAIRLGWYKVHMPVAFYAGFFSAAPGGFDAEIVMGGQKKVQRTMAEISEKGFDATQKETSMVSTLQLVNEAYARGVKFLPVSIYKSDAFAFLPEDGKIRLPFSSLAGLGGTAAQNIARVRDQGDLMSVEDLRRQAQVSGTVIDILRNAGALAGLSETNQITMF